MSHIQYEFLNDSFLFSEQFLSAKVDRKEDVEKVFEELTNYYKHTVENFKNIQVEVNFNSEGIRTYINPSSRTERLCNANYLTTQSILRDVCIVSDPLFDECLSLKNYEANSAHSKFLGMENGNPVARVREVCKYLKEMTVFIVEKYLKFVPDITRIAEKGIPISYSPTGFSECFDENLLNWVHQNVEVFPMQKSDEGFLLMKERKLEPCRSIYIEFKGAGQGENGFYNLFEQRVVSTDDESKTAQFVITLPEEAPEPEYFEHWVKQSINQTARRNIAKLEKDIFWSKEFNASISLESTFLKEIATRHYSRNSIAEATEAAGSIDISLSLPTNVNVSNFLKLRKDKRSLLSFRSYLFEKSIELGKLKTKEDIDKFSFEVNDEMKRKLLPEVQNEIESFKAKEVLKWASIAAAIGVGSVGLTGGMAGLLALGLSAGGLKDTRNDLEKLKSMPGYFWSKVQK